MPPERVTVSNTAALWRIARALAVWLAIVCSSCTGTPARQSWEPRLAGDAIVMLGEVHDNAEQHKLRLEVLRRAFQAGWRPALLMEQFDRERQPDIERARREKPTDAQHVIDLAAPHTAGWNWDFYRPFVALALEYDVPLIAANLSRRDATKVVQADSAAVFDAATLAALGLDRPVAPEWEAAQEQEIETGHCHSLPASLLPAMAQAQFARDAVMAALLKEQAAHGAVLLAGNGHARRDIGVPRWLPDSLRTRVFTVGYLEKGDTELAPAFDAVVYTARAKRSPPCAEFEGHKGRG